MLTIEQDGEEVTSLQHDIKLVTKPRSWPKLLLPPVEGHNMPADDAEGNDVEPNDMEVDSQEDVGSQAGTKDKHSDAQEHAESVVGTGIVGELVREESEGLAVDTQVGEVGPGVEADNMEEDLLGGMVPEVDRQEEEGREEGGKENMVHDENMMEEEEPERSELSELSEIESKVTNEAGEEEAQNMEDDSTMGGMAFGYTGKRRSMERNSRDVPMGELSICMSIMARRTEYPIILLDSEIDSDEEEENSDEEEENDFVRSRRTKDPMGELSICMNIMARRTEYPIILLDSEIDSDEEEEHDFIRSRRTKQQGRVGQGAVTPSSSYLTPPTPAQRQKAPNPREEESDTSSSSASQTSTNSSEPNYSKLGTSHKWKKSKPKLPFAHEVHEIIDLTNEWVRSSCSPVEMSNISISG